MSEHEELVSDFIAEALEILDGYDEELVALEKEPSQEALINSVFRRVHNIKGMCGFLGFTGLEALSHAGEDLLASLRQGAIPITSQHIDLLLQLGDSMRVILLTVQRQGNEGGESFEPLLDSLRNAVKTAPTHMCCNLQNNREQPLSSQGKTLRDEPTQPTTPASTSGIDSSLRVDIALLDHLMNLAGELVLARNQILQLTKTHPDPAFRAIVHKLNTVTSELQEGVMKTRVQPIALLWDKLPRIVRDVTHETGKRVTFSTSGGDTEIDRAILEAIKDPIIHLIRNAIDHGIEPASARQAAGKPSEGTLTLQAFPDGGYVIVELRDDGAGLNTEKIRQRAIVQGLLTAKQADGMSDSQIHRLIFTPGFSTADSVTHLSGRGVGMDVVRANIEAISGQVQVASEPGIGTTMRLKIPITLSIIPTLLVSAGMETFAIPEASVLELVKLSPESGLHPIVEVGQSSFIRLRENLLPLVHLNRYLDLTTRAPSTESGVALILCVDGCRFGVVVDEVHDIEEIVVKSLDSRLQALGLYAGATILGDGRIVLIIDPSGMLHFLQLHRPEEVDTFTPTPRPMHDAAPSSMETFLIAATDLAPYTAIPLSYVVRLEKVKATDLVVIGANTTLQYRGVVLTIIDYAQISPTDPCSNNIPIIVLRSEGGREVGLRVHSIVDITTSDLPIHTTFPPPNPLVLGIINHQTTVLLDVSSLCMPQCDLPARISPIQTHLGGSI